MLVTRVVSDIEAINDVFSQGFIVIAGDLLTIVVYLVAMLCVDWKITLVVLTTLPVMFFATWLFKNAVRSSFTDVRNQVSRLNTFVQEHISGMKIVQVFNREKWRCKVFVLLTGNIVMQMFVRYFITPYFFQWWSCLYRFHLDY